MNQIVQAGKDGTLTIPSLGRTIKLVEWREDGFYDTVQFPALTPAAGTSLEVFRDLSNKNLQHTNLRTARRIPSGSEFIMIRVGVVPAQAVADTVISDSDVIKLAYAATLTFKLGERLITEGPLYRYQSGYGVTGSTTRNAAGVVTIGVPSAAAAPTLMVAQAVSDADDLVCTVDVKDNSWINGGSLMPTFAYRPVVTVLTYGFIKKPSGR